MTDLDPTLFQPSKFVQRQVGRLRVRCIYHEAGCPWQGFFSDPHSEQCGFGMQECPNEGCKERLSRMDLQQHECPYELLTCPNLMPLCKPFYRKDKDAHEKSCRSYPCHYAMAGCPFIGTLEDVNAHCDVYCGKLHQRIKDLEAECERLKKCVVEGKQPESISEPADDEDMGGIQLLEQMLSGNSDYLSLGLLNDKQDATDSKPPPAEQQQQQQQQPQQEPPPPPLGLFNADLMDLSDCLPPISFDKPAVAAPKRSSNGQIIRYSRNVRLAHRTLRMARQQQQQQQQNRYMSDEYPFENLLEDLDVAVKPVPPDNASTTPMNAATPASVSSQQEDLANLLAQQSLSSPQHSPFAFNSLEDVTKYLSELAPPQQEEKPASPAYTTPVAQSPLRNSTSAKTTKSSSTSNRTPRKPDVKKDKKPVPPSSPTNAASPPTDGPKKRPMFVLASTYLANYGNNKQQPS
ncbi:hypothetical protein BJV82DRAFT_574999 [Fennellomyces sp. T-0311]|nr:hypothetical protein BJV82DRAFT_574999 [Fennellomyces sp. T-0311]